MERVWNSVIICIKKHTDTYRHKSREIERVDFIDHVPIEEKRRQIRLGSFMNGRDAMSYAFTELPIQTGCCSVITSFLFMTIFFFINVHVIFLAQLLIGDRNSMLDSLLIVVIVGHMKWWVTHQQGFFLLLLLRQLEEEWLSKIHQSTKL